MLSYRLRRRKYLFGEGRGRGRARGILVFGATFSKFPSFYKLFLCVIL